MDNIILLKKIIKTNFPFSYISGIYGYGSGFYPTSAKTNNMIDLLFIVPDLYKFHIQNKKINYNHYSILDKYFNKSYIINNTLSQVYYNQNILIKGYKFKYGIIEENTFKNSLCTWSNFFICGRFHKPITNIYTTKEYDNYIKLNRKYAFNLVSLMNDMNNIDKHKFYYDILNLSYIGDIRNILNIDNINKKKGMINKYYNLYDSIYNKYFNEYDINKSYNSLPFEFRKKLGKAFMNLNTPERRYIIKKVLKRINNKLSIKSLIMGIYTSPDINYIYNKIKKIKYY